ncbi:MAG: SUF system Fe-S cluster assembly regulator [Alphaproteobacteria bacterium]|nr:MAG: SUF system Fe-S cluster assembly regulator [Alphaproteobacteria bacterium]
MFRLNRLTDYAVVVMSQMSQAPASTWTAPQISQDTGVPLPTVAKLLNALAHGGLITSQRGATGGYTLNRPAEEITVAEIIQALEGPIALTACVDGAAGGCDVETLCPMRGNWDRVNQAIRRALSEVTLADMAVSFDFVPARAPASPPGTPKVEEGAERS